MRISVTTIPARGVRRGDGGRKEGGDGRKQKRGCTKEEWGRKGDSGERGASTLPRRPRTHKDRHTTHLALHAIVQERLDLLNVDRLLKEVSLARYGAELRELGDTVHCHRWRCSSQPTKRGCSSRLAIDRTLERDRSLFQSCLVGIIGGKKRCRSGDLDS